jgi:ubiquitin-like 1-activating enzyme E1 A
VRNGDTAAAIVDEEEEMVGFLKREKVDVVVCCDLEQGQIVRLPTVMMRCGHCAHYSMSRRR